jgi:hypothetical protein
MATDTNKKRNFVLLILQKKKIQSINTTQINYAKSDFEE